MGRIALIFIVFFGILFFSGCEKDDICVDADTPQLTIRFYDFFDTTMLKDVEALNVQGILGNTVFPVITNVSLSEIKVPLRADATSTSFLITRNLTPEDPETADIDTVTFVYELNRKFESRACGFVMNFNEIQGTIPVDANNWTQDIQIVTPSLTQNDTIANVKIFH
ncbi:MAG: DUF6452 family protein [Aurantibacter sp.]